MLGWSSYVVVTNYLKFSLAKCIKICFFCSAGQWGVPLIVVTQQLRLRNFPVPPMQDLIFTAMPESKEMLSETEQNKK